MRSLIKMAFLLLIPYYSSGQQLLEWGFISKHQADSMLFVVKNTANDTVKMSTARSLGFYYQELSADSALYFHEQQLQLAKKLDLKIWEAEAYSQRGYVLDLLNKFPESLESFFQGKFIAEDEKNELKNWHVYTFSKAENFHSSRLAVLAMLYNDLGNLYNDVADTLQQKIAYLKAIEIASSISNNRILERGYSNLAQYYRVIAPDSAFFYTNKAIYYGQLSGFKKYLGSNYLKLAIVYEKRGETDSALAYFKASILNHQQSNNLRGLLNSYIFYSSYFSRQHQIDSAILYGYKALELGQQTKLSNELTNSYVALVQAYRNTTHIDSAYKYLELASKLNDSLKIARIKQMSQYQTVSFNEQLKLKKLQEEKKTYQNKIRTNALIGILFTFFIIAIFLFRNNLQKQKAKQNIEQAYQQLKSTQSQLVQSEKMASLGELTAGIAHEIQNPLNFVNNFSEVSTELIDEIQEERNKEQGTRNEELETEILNDIKQNLEKINHHGKRADAIVKGMLQHSRSSNGIKEPTDINALCDEYLRLSYHGLRAKDKSFNATLKTDFDPSIGKINIIPQDIGRVIMNLLTNAFYAVNEKALSAVSTPTAAKYEPTVSISTKKIGDKIEIKVGDNGNGIPTKVLDKIFQPFFTTKPTGQGTGLGLSLSYDIITKGHNGELKVETKENEGSQFIIQFQNI